MSLCPPYDKCLLFLIISAHFILIVERYFL